jgi:hypothetical protein
MLHNSASQKSHLAFLEQQFSSSFFFSPQHLRTLTRRSDAQQLSKVRRTEPEITSKKLELIVQDASQVEQHEEEGGRGRREGTKADQAAGERGKDRKGKEEGAAGKEGCGQGKRGFEHLNRRGFQGRGRSRANKSTYCCIFHSMLLFGECFIFYLKKSLLYFEFFIYLVL